jgi:hypothetical protein
MVPAKLCTIVYPGPDHGQPQRPINGFPAFDSGNALDRMERRRKTPTPTCRTRRLGTISMIG